MTTRIAAIALFLLTAAHGAAAQPAPIPENDFQVWNDVTVGFPVVESKDAAGKQFDRLTLNLLGTLRLGQNRLAPVDERIGAGVDLFVNKYLTLGSSYLYIAAQPGRARREFEHRLRFEANLEKRFAAFALRSRSRMEYRIRHSRSDSVRFRNRFMLRVPVRENGKELFVPFVATEPYYGFTEKRWTRNDFTAGISRRLATNVTAEFYYLWRHTFQGRPVNVHAIGTSFRFRVD